MGADNSLADIQIRISELEKTILDLQLQHKEKKSRMQLALIESYENLIGSIVSWEKKYVLVAPIDGIVTFTEYWSDHQNVNTGDCVMSIVPGGADNIVGRIKLPVLGAGKVKPKQRINIKFSNFPYMEFGMVSGTVEGISLVTVRDCYIVEVGLTDGLTTSYGRTLKFRQGMQGVAEIITDDVRLLERIVNPIKSLWRS